MRNNARRNAEIEKQNRNSEERKKLLFFYFSFQYQLRRSEDGVKKRAAFCPHQHLARLSICLPRLWSAH